MSEAAHIGADGGFFAPKFLHWMFGEDEQVMGYEGLQVTIYLSARRLIPFVEIKYEKKAPAFAKVDNVEDKLRNHYGTIYTDLAEYTSKVLESERDNFEPYGEYFGELGKEYAINQISLGNISESFMEQNAFAQALLPFFIDGATPVEPSSYWKYFLVYSRSTGELAALFTVFEAFLSADKMRTKISQVLVLPPY